MVMVYIAHTVTIVSWLNTPANYSLKISMHGVQRPPVAWFH